MVWAYADEIVQAASNMSEAMGLAETGYAQSQMDRERIGGGTINGWYEPHPDALAIHAKLRAWFCHDGAALALVIWHAERRRLLPPSISLPRLKAVMVTDRNGNVLIERRRAHRKARALTEYCLVEFEGVDAKVAELRERAHREVHALFVAFLDAMPGFPLTRWKVAGRGLTDVGESLTT